MAKIPEEVLRTVERITAQHPNDISAAVEESVAAVRLLDDFEEYIDALVHDAVQGQVYACRHNTNVTMKRDTGQYGGAHKVNGASTTVERIYHSHYLYCIAGKTLGEILGDEIDAIVEGERAVASGHEFNARLLSWCQAQGVIGDKKVSDVISERKLKTHFNRIQKEVQGREMAMAGH